MTKLFDASAIKVKQEIWNLRGDILSFSKRSKSLENEYVGVSKIDPYKIAQTTNLYKLRDSLQNIEKLLHSDIIGDTYSPKVYLKKNYESEDHIYYKPKFFNKISMTNLVNLYDDGAPIADINCVDKDRKCKVLVYDKNYEGYMNYNSSLYTTELFNDKK